MRPTTLVELAAEAGRTAPDPRGFTTFAEFQQVYGAAYDATSTRPDNLRRVVTELVEDTAADGGVWVGQRAGKGVAQGSSSRRSPLAR